MTLRAVAVSGRGLVDPNEPVLHADDEGFLRGRGVFETLRVYGGRPFRLGEHLARLARSASRLGLSTPEPAQIEALATEALAAAGLEDAMLRIYATPGREGHGAPALLVLVGDLPPSLEETRARGLRLVSVPLGYDSTWLLAGVKSTSYALNMAAVDEARRRGSDDALFVTRDEYVLEGSTTNVWWRRERTLFTPSLDLGILAGVTRAVLLDAAPALGYEVVEGAFPASDLAGAEEAFTSSSVREVMPVIALDDAPVGDGTPGPAARRLQAALRDTACR